MSSSWTQFSVILDLRQRRGRLNAVKLGGAARSSYPAALIVAWHNLVMDASTETRSSPFGRSGYLAFSEYACFNTETNSSSFEESAPSNFNLAAHNA